MQGDVVGGVTGGIVY